MKTPTHQPKLERCSWIKGKKMFYIQDGCTPSLILYPLSLSKGEKFSDPTKWVPLFHQTAGYACHHLYFHALFLKPKKNILPLMDELELNWEESCVYAPPSLKTANKYQKLLETYGLSANHTYSELQEGFYPIDIGFLPKVTASVYPKRLEELIQKPKRKKPSFLDKLPHHWGLAILGQNCD